MLTGTIRISAIALAVCVAAAEPTVRIEHGRFVILGWTPPAIPPADGWSSIFTVQVGDATAPSVLGTYMVEGERLVFQPRFPLSPGVRGRFELRIPGSTPTHGSFEIAKTAMPPRTRVVEVYPTTDILPENQLKFYVEFSAPMARGEAWRHIWLIDDKDRQVELPFLELDQELWDAAGKRLTILFDPGRIKRGVKPLEEVGPAIERGKRYRLVIDSRWPDAKSQPLEGAFGKTFRVEGADRTPPDPNTWKVETPTVHTLEPLVVKFPEPLDYALLTRLLRITNGKDLVAGTPALGRNETQWSFVPREPWKSGSYQLLIDTTLEDLAGNRIGRVFDVDTFDPITRRLTQKTISIPLHIGKASGRVPTRQLKVAAPPVNSR